MKPIYIILTFILYASYFAAYVGVYYLNPTYVNMLSRTIRLVVCLFLLQRFHPFKQSHSTNEFDVKIIFASAVLLLTDLGITQLIVDNTVKKLM